MNTLHGSTGDEQQDMTGRESLVEQCLAQLFEAYDEALAFGISDPVLFLVDCDDEIGGPISRAWEGDDAVNAATLTSTDHLESSDEATATTTLARAFPFRDSCVEVPKVFPYLEETFQRPPPKDGFLVLAIAYGGAATFTVPLGSRPE